MISLFSESGDGQCSLLQNCKGAYKAKLPSLLLQLGLGSLLIVIIFYFYCPFQISSSLTSPSAGLCGLTERVTQAFNLKGSGNLVALLLQLCG